MSVNTVFLDRISTVKKLVFMKALYRIVLLTLLFFLCLYTLAIGLEKFDIFQARDDVFFYGISFGISLGVALLYVYIKREDFTNVLIDIDTRLNLQDRISTAYEYQSLGKQSEFTELLIEDAGHRISGLSNKQLLPPKFSLVHLLLSILIVINIALVFVDLFSFGSKQEPVDPEQAKKINTVLQNYTRKKKSEREEETNENVQKRVSEKLENLSKQLQERTMTQNELEKSLRKTLQEVQGEQSRLTKALGSKLEDIENLRDIPMRQIPSLRQLSSSELNKLRKMLENMLNNQIPESIEQDLALLDEYNNLEELLEQLMDDVESGTEDEGEPDSDGPDATAQSSDDVEEGESSSEDATQSEASSDSPQGEEGSTGQAVPGEGSEDGRIGESDEGEEGFSSSVGRGRGDGEQYSPYDLENPENPATQDTMISGTKNDYNVHIRSVTKFGEATVPEEDVPRLYQQEVESILQKEDIPLNYREYIKNYFISIGLRKEEQNNDTTQ